MTRIAPQTRTDRGWIRGQPQRFLPGHNLPRRDDPFPCELDEATGCLIWKGGIGGKGYGYVDKRTYAHRVAYERANGTIPDGHEIHHRCERKLCCNPEHMELLSKSDHTHRHHELRAA